MLMDLIPRSFMASVVGSGMAGKGMWPQFGECIRGCQNVVTGADFPLCRRQKIQVIARQPARAGGDVRAARHRHATLLRSSFASLQLQT